MKIRLAITDERIPENMRRRLSLCSFHVLTLPPFSVLSEAVSSHTDMLLTRLGDELISTADYCEQAPWVFTDLTSLMSGKKTVLTSDTLGKDYPDDCRLNVLRIGSYLFAKCDTVSPYILKKAAELGLKTVDVRQGYPACTVLKLGESAAITADKGMARALRECGIEVTEIECGDISLPPYDYGFIGGTAGAYDGKIYFLGDPKTHRSYSLIKSACDKARLDIVSLGDGRLIDLGGILFVEGDIKQNG